MFYIKYLTMYKVRMHADAIRKLLYVCAYVHNPYNEALNVFMDIGIFAKRDTFMNIQSTFKDMAIQSFLKWGEFWGYLPISF